MNTWLWHLSYTNLINQPKSGQRNSEQKWTKRSESTSFFFCFFLLTMGTGWGCSCCQGGSWQGWLSWWTSPSPGCQWSPASVRQTHLTASKHTIQTAGIGLQRHLTLEVTVCVLVCTFWDADRVLLDEGGNRRDGFSSSVSWWRQQGGGAWRQRAEVTVLCQWKHVNSSVRTNNRPRSGTTKQEQPTHLSHHSGPQERGYEGRSPVCSVKARDKDNESRNCLSLELI